MQRLSVVLFGTQGSAICLSLPMPEKTRPFFWASVPVVSSSLPVGSIFSLYFNITGTCTLIKMMMLLAGR
jgi:hypothetical protein